MKAAELRSKKEEQLKDMLVQLKKESFNLRFQQASGELTNTNRMREVKKEIARVKTVMAEMFRKETKAKAGA